MVSDPGLSERKAFMFGDSLIPYLVILLVTVSYICQDGFQDGCLLKWMPW